MAGVADHTVSLLNGGISIMAFGKTGIGKSTLLNVLLGTKDKFDVKGPGDDDEDEGLGAGTKELSIQSEIIQGIKVTLYDTPGLQPDTHLRDNYFADSIGKINTLVKESIDLLLFCIDGTTTRWAMEEETVKKLHSYFGNEMWRHAIVVLTRSNIAQPGLTGDPQLASDSAKANICKKAAMAIFNTFKKELREQRVPAEIIDHIPLVAAGNKHQRKLFFVAREVYYKDFLPELWSQAVKRCRDESKEKFIKVSNYDITFEGISQTPEVQAEINRVCRDAGLVNDLPSSSSPKTDETQRPEIKLNKKQTTRVFKALSKSAIGGVIGGLVSGTAGGATSGITVGAAVWGATTLTMAVAGPVGVAVGVVGGLGVAVVTGIIIYHIIKKIQENDQMKQEAASEVPVKT